jgi:hypothetical protein
MMNVAPLLFALGPNILLEKCTLYSKMYRVSLYKFYVGCDLPEAVG